MWVFGYGSLIWKVDFPYEKRLVGHIKGYIRRFYQHSIDHRGVPEKPGRVVTLIPCNEPNSSVWGVAYNINESDRVNVANHLDFREKNGYSKSSVKFYPKDTLIEPFDLVIYVAEKDNISFAGEADIETIAKQIVNCVGPSGTNKEYLYKLAEAMRTIAPDVYDEHLFRLEEAVKRLDK